MSLDSLRRHLSELKLELLEDGEHDADAPVIRGQVQTPSKTRTGSGNPIFRSPVTAPFDIDKHAVGGESSDELSTLKRRLDEAQRKIEENEAEIATLRQTTKSAPFLIAQAESIAIARTTELAMAKHQLQEASSQATLSAQYYDRLFRTLGAEFVLAVQHIGVLESTLAVNELPVPMRPDFAAHDVDAPPLPPHVRHMVNQHAANIVASAAVSLSNEVELQTAPIDQSEIEAYRLQQEQMLAQQQAAMLAYQQQMQQFYEMQQQQTEETEEAEEAEEDVDGEDGEVTAV